jgi:excisionase family DNA binding protein
MKRVEKPSERTPVTRGTAGVIAGSELATDKDQLSVADTRGGDFERAPLVSTTSWLISSAYMDLLARPALSVKQAAQIFGVGEKAVRTMCRHGVLEELRAGRLVRISTQSVRKLLGLHA